MSEWRQQSLKLDDTSYAYVYATIFDLIELARGKQDALIVVLDHVTDVGNLGAIIRSAEVVGATGVIIPKKRSAGVNSTVYRTSAGAVDYIKVAQEANIAQSLKRLQSEGFWVAGASPTASLALWEAPLEGRLALVLGAEDVGISRLVKEICDFEFTLPQRGFTQSLNVAQAATAIMYEWLRRIQ